MKKLSLILLLFSAITCITNCYADGQWTQKSNFGGIARHRCTAFAVGNKGYIGGGHINSGQDTYHEDYWQYDPSTDSWTQIADFGGGKRYHSTSFTIGEFAYVGLGEDDMDAYHNDFYRYSAEFNIWQPIANYPGNPRRGASSFVLEDRGYVGTGQSDFGYENDFYKYEPSTNEWYIVSDFIGEARSSAVSFEHEGKGYLGTGHVIGNDTKDFYEYDPFLDSWTQKADVGITNRQDATGFVVNGKGYIGTGNDVAGANNYKDFWEYDFLTDSWIQFNDFCGEGRRYMVSFVIDNIAYAGTGTDGTNLKDFWSFDPLLSIEDEKAINLSVFPNPSNEIIRFNFAAINYDIRIFNLDGKEVFSKNNISSGFKLSIDNIGAGTFLYVISEKGKIIDSKTILFVP